MREEDAIPDPLEEEMGGPTKKAEIMILLNHYGAGEMSLFELVNATWNTAYVRGRLAEYDKRNGNNND